MIYNYSPLWETLKDKNMTRKQLRGTLQLSPATMARMSAGEPIAMETLGRICDYLKCSLDKICTIEPTNEPATNWSSLNNSTYNRPKQTFMVFMYFLLSEDKEESAEYLYGYAMPFTYTERGMNIWNCNFGKDNYKQFCEVKGFLYKNELCQFLDAASNKHTLAEIFKLFKIKLNNIKPEEERQIYRCRVANGNYVYRPPFILPSKNAYLDCLPELKPLLSFTKDTTICESLYGINKQQYYFSENGIDADKVKFLWNYLSDKLPLCHNLNEAARLGNFEVLTYLQEDVRQNPVKCEVWLKDGKSAGAKITINQELAGIFILRTKLFNGRNPILDNAYLIDAQNEEENPVYIPLYEDFFFSEIELWSTIDTDKAGQRLLYQSSTPYVRQIAVNMSIQERSMILEDRWSQTMRKQGKPVDTQVSFFSKYPSSPVIGKEEELWLKEENSIQKDFHAILGNDKRLHDNDAFFPRSSDKAVAFCDWLKETLQAHTQTTRIILFDPYINHTAIDKFIRSIKDVDIHYEIITDSYPAGKNGRETEINEIRKLSTLLPIIATPCKLCIRTFTRHSGTLHDRVLIIADKIHTFVYALSNSLDNMAKDHSSIVTAVKPAVAQEIFSAYVQLVKDAEKDNVMEILYDSQDPKNKNPTPANSNSNKTTNNSAMAVKIHHQEENTYTTADFKKDYGSANTKTALNNLAYIRYNEVEECVNYVLTLDKEAESKRLEDIITETKSDVLPPIRRETGIYILNQNALVKQDFDITGELIEAAEHSIGRCFEYRSVLPHAYSYAIKILWSLSPERFVNYLEKLVDEQPEDKDESAESATITARKILIYSMTVQIAKTISFPKITEEMLQVLAKSKLAYLCALFAAKSIWLSEETLLKIKSIQEYKPDELKQIVQSKCDTICKNMHTTKISTTLIHFIVNLQVEICCNKQLKEHIQPLIDLIAAAYVLQNIKSDANSLKKQLAPLNLRNPGDICQIINALQNTKRLNAEQSYEVLLYFWKLVYTEENGREKNYYDPETIQRSIRIADEIINTGNTNALKLLKEISKTSRVLCAKLYDPLLYSKNYNAWKNSVDQLACLFVTERHIVNQNVGFVMGKGEEEYEKLTQNYDEILNDYSAVYKIWKKQRD